MNLTSTQKAACDHIAAQERALIEQLAEHVSIPTGLNHTAGLDAYRQIVAQRMQRLGATVELAPGDVRPDWLRSAREQTESEQDVVPPVFIARRMVDERHPRVLIVGHLDTVHDPNGPFNRMVVSSDGITATGPGVVDMKGGVLVAMTALEALHHAAVGLNWTLLLNSDEETGSFTSERVLREVAQQHDVGLVMEPALPGGELAVERMGSGQFRIEVFGQSAHVGREFAKGVSAVTELARVILNAASLADPVAGRIVNIGPLQGGSATNVVPDYACCWGNARFADAQIGESLGESLDAFETMEEALPRIRVHRHWNRPAKPLIPATQQLADAARSAAEDLGQSLPFASTGGVCDGNILQDAGLPTIDTLGVRGGNLHRPDEFIELASLVQRSQLLAVLLSRLADGSVQIGREQDGSRPGG